MNMAIFHALEKIPADQHRLVPLEKLDYDCYLDICAFIGSASPISRKVFDEIRQEKPGKGAHHRTVKDWSRKEMEEFLGQTERARKLLGYEDV
jgi:hypothetical protein